MSWESLRCYRIASGHFDVDKARVCSSHWGDVCIEIDALDDVPDLLWFSDDIMRHVVRTYQRRDFVWLRLEPPSLCYLCSSACTRCTWKGKIPSAPCSSMAQNRHYRVHLCQRPASCNNVPPTCMPGDGRRSEVWRTSSFTYTDIHERSADDWRISHWPPADVQISFRSPTVIWTGYPSTDLLRTLASHAFYTYIKETKISPAS